MHLHFIRRRKHRAAHGVFSDGAGNRSLFDYEVSETFLSSNFGRGESRRAGADDNEIELIIHLRKEVLGFLVLGLLSLFFGSGYFHSFFAVRSLGRRPTT